MVRYGIIGSGTMGREHILNLRLIPETRLVALADPHPASLNAAAGLAARRSRPTRTIVPCSHATISTWS
jgi:myo-inositol 2-dehydrogenase / D-chiro-inositol 1-dehydrogenase